VTLDATFEGRGRDPWEFGGVLVGNDIDINLEVQAVKAA
jgi:hypothetical protein